MLLGEGRGTSNDGVWYFLVAQNEASPTQSYFILCDELPSRLGFGVMNGKPQYMINSLKVP
jgi:hypothetical protein